MTRSTTQAMAIIRGVLAEKGKVGCDIYNDKLADGTRSVKIPGAKPKMYAKIVKRLAKAGFKVEQVVTRERVLWGAYVTGGNPRLHIKA